jgi:hypothetical protein
MNEIVEQELDHKFARKRKEMKRLLSSVILEILVLSTFLLLHSGITRGTCGKTIFATGNSRMKGMTVNAWSAEAYNSSDFDQSIVNLAGIETNWVTFTVFWFMESFNDTEINSRSDLYSASNSSLIHAIQKAHELEMSVALKPMVDVADGTWRGQIQPSNWTAWFDSYRNFINYYANLAETNNVELFEVGTELRSSQAATHESEWRQVISEVRTRFSKNITYAANWDSYSTFAPLSQFAVRFWDALDYVGVDAYFPLTNLYNPTVEQLENAWSSCTASGWWGRNWTDDLYSTYTQTGKKIIFTEIGYCSQDGTNTKPYDWNISSTVDLQEQADCYKAALEVFKDKAWFTGWFWWSWETDPNAGGASDKHYTPQNKPAQNTLYQYYCEAPQDIAITNVVPSKTVVGQGYSVIIEVTTENQGNYTETFNVTAYTNTTAIQTTSVVLASGSNVTVTFTWNTTSFANGNYTISAYATPLLGETDTADNEFTGRMVRVTIVGDVAPEFGIVDIVDIVYVAIHFGAEGGEPEYEPNADINGDDIIDIVDIVIVAIHFGETDS